MSENKITAVRLVSDATGWTVEVVKSYTPENGGGTRLFTEHTPGGVHRALDRAREMVTFLPATNDPTAVPGADPGGTTGKDPADAQTGCNAQQRAGYSTSQEYKQAWCTLEHASDYLYAQKAFSTDLTRDRALKGAQVIIREGQRRMQAERAAQKQIASSPR